MRMQVGHGPVEAILPNLAEIITGLKNDCETVVQVPVNDLDEVIDQVEFFASPTQPKNMLPLDIVLQYPKGIGADGVVFVSNSTGPLETPAESDLDFTRRLIQAGDAVGLEIKDHYLADDDDFVSLRDTTDLWS